MVCKGICVRHKAMKPRNPVIGLILQDRNVVRCARPSWYGMDYGVHAVVIDQELDRESQNSKFKAQFRASNVIAKAKSLGVYEQPIIEA